MARDRIDKYNVIAYDIMFLLSFLLTVTSSLLVFLNIAFLIPAVLSFSIWLILTLIVLRKKGVSMKRSVLEGRLISGLPSNKKLHFIYIGALLISLMLFFALMVIAKELYLLFAFMIWLFIGSLVMQELGGGTESTEEKKIAGK